ncbi:MAG: DUF4430 domain-containing protein [Patescibacteria group bacterium]|nr:DUF4430 domain-containing protein [Patescibacteria group bacterium]
MKKYFLLTISFIIVALILSFGQAAYHKQKTGDNNNSKTTATIDTAKIVPKTKEPKNERISMVSLKANQSRILDRTEPVGTEEPNSLKTNNTQTAETGSADITTTQTPQSSTPNVTKPSAEPTKNIIAKTVQLKIQGLDSYKIDWTENDNGWDIMRKAADKYAFLLVYKNYGWGMWVKQIGKLAEHDNYYWALYYNNGYSQVGITDLKPQANDIIEWKMETW